MIHIFFELDEFEIELLSICDLFCFGKEIIKQEQTIQQQKHTN